MNAPAMFSRMMEMVLSDIVWKECLVYLDDVISFGRTYDLTLQSLRAVMMRLRAHNLKLNRANVSSSELRWNTWVMRSDSRESAPRCQRFKPCMIGSCLPT